MAIAIDYLIRSIIKKYFEQGKPDKIRTEGVDEIKAVIKREGGLWKDYQGKISGYTKSISAEFTANFAKTNGADISIIDKQAFSSILQRLEKKSTDRAEEVYRTMREALAKATELDKPWQDVARTMLRKIKLQDSYIATEINTAENSLDNLSRFQSFRRAGVEKLIYDGPLPERKWCKDHYKHVYTLKEVEEMVNQFGEPAFVYCGGFNCTHRFSPFLG